MMFGRSFDGSSRDRHRGLGGFGLCGMLLALRGSGAVVVRVFAWGHSGGGRHLSVLSWPRCLFEVARGCLVGLSSVCVLFPDG